MKVDPTRRTDMAEKQRDWPDAFEEAIDGLGPDADGRIDVKARASLGDPDYRPPLWFDDGPDPFGLDWAWERAEDRLQICG